MAKKSAKLSDELADRETPLAAAPVRPPSVKRVQALIEKRKARFRSQLGNPNLEHFGHDSVREVLRFWKIAV
jgi:hypothetical protein